MSKDYRYLLYGLLLLPLIVLANIARGQADLSMVQLLGIFLGQQSDSTYSVIVHFRLPRAVVGVLAGASLAVIGTLLQTTLRNSLVSAGTLGINAGAYFAAVAATVFLPMWIGRYPLMITFVGGLLAVVLVYVLAGRATSSPLRMVLAGMIVTMLLGSLSNAIQILFEHDTRQLLIWGNGSLAQNDWQVVTRIWPLIAGGLLLAVLGSRQLDVIRLGEELAGSLGQRVALIKLGVIVLSVFLAALIVSMTGPIGFVGLVAPHLVKLAGFRRHLTLLPAAALCGALLLLLADTLTYRPGTIANQIPVGAVMALIGAPWLLLMALRMSRRSGLGVGLQNVSLRSARPDKRLPFFIVVILLLLLLSSAFTAGNLMSSGAPLPLADVLHVLVGKGDVMTERILLQFRMPRITAAMLAGAMLAVSGLLVQGSVRNPLADPSIIGVSSGAGAGVLGLIVLHPAATAWQYSLAALIGAFLAAGITFMLSWRSKFQPGLFIMIGIAVSAAFSAVIQILILQTPYSISAQIWMGGSTYALRWSAVLVLACAAAVLLPAAWLIGRRVELLGFDEQAVIGMGLKPQSVRFIALLLGVCLSAIAVSQVGTIGFIGLLAPHAAHLLQGHAFRKKVILAALLGALMLAVSDLLGRIIMIPNEIPSGTVVVLVGAPYLFYLIAVSQRQVRG